MSMPVSQVMTREVVTLRPDDSWLCAVRSIVERGVHALPVVDDGGTVLGMVAESDLMPKEERLDRQPHLLPTLQRPRDRRRARATTVGEVMQGHPVTVSPETPLGEAGRIMHRRHVGRLPVVDGDGRLVGIVTRRDLLATFLRADEEIEADARQALARLGQDCADAVEVSARDGVVVLRGRVGYRSQGMDAAELVEQVPGVVAVDSRLECAVDDVSVTSGA